MKATCPNCSSTYKVADEKIPEVGAQIKCPKCNTLFVVRRPPPVSAPPPPAERTHEAATPVQELMSASPSGTASPPPLKDSLGTYSVQKVGKPPAQVEQAPAQSAVEELTPYLDALSGEAEISARPAGAPEFDSSGAPLGTDPSAAARGMSAIRAQSKIGAKAAGELQDSYRVRTARGLTYDFSGRDAMLRWLGGRQDLKGCEVSEPGKDWVPAGELLGEGLVGAAPVVLEEEEEAYIPEPGESVPGLPDAEEAPHKPFNFLPLVMWVAVSLSVIVLLFTAAATLTRYGVVNLSSYLPLSVVGVEFPGEAATLASEEVPGEVVEEDPGQAYTEALNLANRSIRSKRFSKAALEYNRALTIRPDSVEALQGLAKAYNGLGDHARAQAALKKAKAQAKNEAAPKAKN